MVLSFPVTTRNRFAVNSTRPGISLKRPIGDFSYFLFFLWFFLSFLSFSFDRLATGLLAVSYGFASRFSISALFLRTHPFHFGSRCHEQVLLVSSVNIAITSVGSINDMASV